jgi:3-hydroxyisobutyrate dehydrogenase-like beta-hydroxyacid dehydrogenase
MARNMIKAGHTLTVYNRTKSRADEFRSSGVAVASTPGEAASGADVVITMLSDDKAVQDVVFEPSGILAALPAGAIHVSMSTISVALSRSLAVAHREKGQHYVAAPMFGRPEAAAAAKLFVVAAGAKRDIDRCHPLFDRAEDLHGQRRRVAGERRESHGQFSDHSGDREHGRIVCARAKGRSGTGDISRCHDE